LYHPIRRIVDLGLPCASTCFRAPIAPGRNRDDAERDAAFNAISSINQKNAPPREARNPFRHFRIEMRAAAPACQGK